MSIDRINDKKVASDMMRMTPSDGSSRKKKSEPTIESMSRDSASLGITDKLAEIEKRLKSIEEMVLHQGSKGAASCSMSDDMKALVQMFTVFMQNQMMQSQQAPVVQRIDKRPLRAHSGISKSVEPQVVNPEVEAQNLEELNSMKNLEIASQEKAKLEDMRQAELIYAQMRADEAKWQAKIWQINSDAQTEINQTVIAAAQRKKQMYDNLINQWTNPMGMGMGIGAQPFGAPGAF